jgi:hypothetical protein
MMSTADLQDRDCFTHILGYELCSSYWRPYCACEMWNRNKRAVPLLNLCLSVHLDSLTCSIMTDCYATFFDIFTFSAVIKSSHRSIQWIHFIFTRASSNYSDFSWNVIFIWETGYWTRAKKRFALFDLLKSLYSNTKILSKYIPSLQKRLWAMHFHIVKMYKDKEV